jgi:deoxyadenosine/deoxycytidine kinase
MNIIPKIISIDGNIGSGKTTLLKALKEKYLLNPDVIFLTEPVSEWEKIKDSDGKTILEKFYLNQDKYAFSFQMMAYISRLAIVKNAVNKNPDAIFITERSLYTDKYIFAKMLYDQGKIEEINYKIYLNWFDEFAKDYPIAKIIWVNTDPEICHQRIKKRARLGEEIIPLNYLEQCDKYHIIFIKDMHVQTFKLDGNQDIFENKDILESWIKQIDYLIDNISKKL